MLAYARAFGVTYYTQNYASIIRQPLLVTYLYQTGSGGMCGWLACPFDKTTSGHASA